MPHSLRIATWNLHRPTQHDWTVWDILQKINDINADIWILTATHPDIDLGKGYYRLSATAQDLSHSPEPCSTTLWFRYPIKRRVETLDHQLAVCAEVRTPFGDMLIYGANIASPMEVGSTDSNVQAWHRHYDAIQTCIRDWEALNQTGLPICVAGDFQTSLDVPFGRSIPGEQAMLRAALRRNDLTCLTSNPEMWGNDHICLSSPLATKVMPHSIAPWLSPATEGIETEYDGVCIELGIQERR